MQPLPCPLILASLIGLPPQLMLLVTLGGIFYLFRRDFRQKPNVTTAIWIPIVWLFIIASRPISTWFQILGLPVLTAGSVEEGSPADAACFFTLMALGLYVISKRQVSLSTLVQDNPWLALFFVYCFLAVFWSDFPVTSFKRWLKIFSHPIMVLVILTEPNPGQALTIVMKRCAYVLFPVSILWMKYYPGLGWTSDEWGATMNVGITGGKNELGAICVIFGLFLIWYWLQVWRSPKTIDRRRELILTSGILLLIAYCLRKSHSSTSILSVLIAALVMMSLGLRLVNKKIIGLYAVAVIAVLGLAQITFDVYGNIVELTGHESTIEGRGHLWQTLLETDTSPLFGTGFESYWLGDRVQKIWDMPEFWWDPTQAHNGYLEAYLNLGAVGLLILLGLILAAFRKCRQDLLINFEWGRFTMSYLIAILAHNWTEAGFKGLSVIFFGFFLIATKSRYLQFDKVAAPDESASLVDDAELVYGEATAWRNRAC
jgi:exopolysaccharide production protein ExoQ